MLKRLGQWMKAEDSRPEGDPRAPWRLFWVAFLGRVAYMTLAHTFRVRPYMDHFGFGWEAGRIARSLATGHGYANAFGIDTGPTAWLPPVFPLLLGGIFRIFGVYTPLSAWVVLAINCAFSAATALAVWEIGRRCFSRSNAVWAGWLWALYPAAMQYSVRWIWETSLTVCLLAWIIVLALRMRGIGDAPGYAARETASQAANWMAFGLFWGVIALSNSSLLLFLPASALWILYGTWRRPHVLRDVTVAAMLTLATIAPWEARNYAVFHRFIPIRGNLGAEAALGNGPGARGFLMEYNHPNQSTEQLRLYRQMGEVRYSAMRGELAGETIRANPALYVKNTLKRIYFFWASVPSDQPFWTEFPRTLSYAFLSLAGLLGLALALHRRAPAAWLFAMAFFLLPLPYYFVTVHARFRHPLEPLIAVLGVYLFQSATPRKSSNLNRASG
jgi:4-amino-4-deoxy-L-arabinose transferase-like glycosyltransferase